MKERTKLALLIGVLAACGLIPFAEPGLRRAALEAFLLLGEYVREHVLFCLVPAFFIAGAISVFLSQQAVLRYLGARARKAVAYGVASVSGGILAVCSCTVLPIFAGIYGRGAGLGPATAFLYSGPAINVLAIILTARVLGPELGLARALGAVVFSVVIGLSMSAIFRREEERRVEAAAEPPDAPARPGRSRTRTAVLFVSLLGVLVFAAWGRPKEPVGFAEAVWKVHWYAAAAFLLVALHAAFRWLSREEREDWVLESFGFAKLILPLLIAGVLVAGFLLGRPESGGGLIAGSWIGDLVGGNSITANLVAALSGALMYFATLTEVPILEGLLAQGMGKGPALALLLAGPAVSLPSLLVVRGVLGTKKTLVYAGLVVVLSSVAGWLYGAIA